MFLTSLEDRWVDGWSGRRRPVWRLLPEPPRTSPGWKNETSVSGSAASGTSFKGAELLTSSPDPPGGKLRSSRSLRYANSGAGSQEADWSHDPAAICVETGRQTGLQEKRPLGACKKHPLRRRGPASQGAAQNDAAPTHRLHQSGCSTELVVSCSRGGGAAAATSALWIFLPATAACHDLTRREPISPDPPHGPRPPGSVERCQEKDWIHSSTNQRLASIPPPRLSSRFWRLSRQKVLGSNPSLWSLCGFSHLQQKQKRLQS